MPLTLCWKDATRLPVEAETLQPERLFGLSVADVSRVKVPHGNAPSEVGELFHVEGSVDDGHLIFEGDLRAVRAIGSRMKSGRLTVVGDTGARLGLGMVGGELSVNGSVGPWAGAEMSGGLLRISGGAGDYLGAALPGSSIGMRGGVILVGGSVGDDAGLAMRRGLITVGGWAGSGLGRAMVAGSVFVFGRTGQLAGAGMKRGTIALFGQPDPSEPGILPTFTPSGLDRPPFVTIYLKKLLAWGFEVPRKVFSGKLARYNGDVAVGGQGEIHVWI